MTDGLEVLVQLVIAAITTEPLSIVVGLPLMAAPFILMVTSLCAAPNAASKFFFTSGRLTRSCGRFGPAIDGVTVARSRSTVSAYAGSGVASVRNRPCSLV